MQQFILGRLSANKWKTYLLSKYIKIPNQTYSQIFVFWSSVDIIVFVYDYR